MQRLIHQSINKDEMWIWDNTHANTNSSVYILEIVILFVKMLHGSLELLDDGFVLFDVLILL